MKPRKIKSIVSAVLLAAGIVEASAQSTEPFNPYSEFKASAEAWAMSRYGNAKPTFYTGAMSYSVALFSYNDPDFDIPASLEYHFDGYRPSQHSGTVGYGWHLDFGGVITRDVRGLPDDDIVYGPADRVMLGYLRTIKDGYSPDTLGNNRWWNIYCNSLCTDYPTKEMGMNLNPFTHIPVYVESDMVDGVPIPSSWKSYDLTPDIYSFNLPGGHSGSFMLCSDGSVRVFGSDLPYGELEVEIIGQTLCRWGSEPEVCSFTIRTGDGTKYLFGGNTNAIEYASFQSTNPDSNMPSCSATAFRLVKIIAPNGREAVFSYSTPKQTSVSSSRSFTPEWRGGNYTQASTLVKNKSFSYFSVPESVTVDGVKVLEFSYSAKDSDENAAAYFYDIAPSVNPNSISGLVLAPSALRLSGVTFRNAAGETVGSAVLSQMYAGGDGTPKMFLQSVNTTGSGEHRFQYDLGRSLPRNDQPETDHWGFWNGSFISDFRNFLQFSGSRYSQFTTPGIKEPHWQYALSGALTEIIYPTGGRTQISYEGNRTKAGLDEEGQIYIPSGGDIDVGGVRVATITDFSSTDSAGETTSFSYYGGFLYHMPRYLFTLWINYNNAFAVPADVNLYGFMTGYNADVDYSVSRDENIGYAKVCCTHPDGSETEYEFSCWQDGRADEFKGEGETFPYKYLPKLGVYCGIDYINEQMSTTMGPYIARAFTDRHNMRGRLLRETIIDVLGNPVRRTEYKYTAETVSLKQMWWNDLDHFNCSPWTCESPLLEEVKVTDYGDDGSSLHVMTTYGYNVLGQQTSSKEHSSSNPGCWSAVYRMYLHESSSPYRYGALPRALYSIAFTNAVDGEEYLTGGETLSYASIPSNHINPTSVTQNIFDIPKVVNGAASALSALSIGGARTTSFQYNAQLRPSTVTLPGGKVITYLWNGNHIIRKTVGSGGTTFYGWKDQVGLTSLTDPSGRVSTYGYDARGHLSTVKDTTGREVERYDYNLENE